MLSRITKKLFRTNYQSSIANLKNAIAADKVRPEDKLAEIVNLEALAGWDSWTEGADWVELEMFAKEKNLRLETVADLVVILQRLST